MKAPPLIPSILLAALVGITIGHWSTKSPKPVKPPVKPSELIPPPLEQLMPKFEIRSNAPNDFRVAFMAYNSTNWVVLTNQFPNPEIVQRVIDQSKERLEALENKYRLNHALFLLKRGIQ